MRAVAPVLLLLASACSDPLVLDGQVTDVWGQPIQDAVVQLEGHVGNVNTDGSGAFSFEAEEGQTTFRVQAGKEGYIPGVVQVAVAAEAEEVDEAVLKLYPVPERVGFYAVDKKGFAHLVAEKIQTKGTDVEAITGLPKNGDVHLHTQKPLEFVFSSTLQSSELSKLDLRLHKLDYVESQTVPGVLGETDVKIDLWVAEGRSEFELKGMPRENTYLITTSGKLEQGTYAFSTQGVLTRDSSSALDKLPEEMRVAYPFRVN